MNSTVRPIFNKSFVEKRGLQIPWTMHETHWNTFLNEKKKTLNTGHGMHYSCGSHLWKCQKPKCKNRNAIQTGINKNVRLT